MHAMREGFRRGYEATEQQTKPGLGWEAPGGHADPTSDVGAGRLQAPGSSCSRGLPGCGQPNCCRAGSDRPRQMRARACTERRVRSHTRPTPGEHVGRCAVVWGNDKRACGNWLSAQTGLRTGARAGSSPKVRKAALTYLLQRGVGKASANDLEIP